MVRKIGKVTSWVLMVLLILAVLVMAVPRLFGVQMYSVLSGSMEPAYSVGDLIYAVPTDPATIEKGDVITFIMNDKGRVATHRVVEADAQNQQFHTKGDANEITDGNPVSFKNVVGVVRFSIPVVGYLLGYMNTVPGKIISVTIMVALILLIILLRRTGEEEEDDGPEQDPVRNGKRRRAEFEPNPQKNWAKHGAYAFSPQNVASFDLDIEEDEQIPNVIEDEFETPEESIPNVSNFEYIPEPMAESEPAVFREPIPAYKQEKPAPPRPQRSMAQNMQRGTNTLPTRETEENDGYTFERLQVCWKMLSLFERMWDDTMSQPYRGVAKSEQSAMPNLYSLDDSQRSDIVELPILNSQENMHNQRRCEGK